MTLLVKALSIKTVIARSFNGITASDISNVLY